MKESIDKVITAASTGCLHKMLLTHMLELVGESFRIKIVHLSLDDNKKHWGEKNNWFTK